MTLKVYKINEAVLNDCIANTNAYMREAYKLASILLSARDNLEIRGVINLDTLYEMFKELYVDCDYWLGEHFYGSSIDDWQAEDALDEMGFWVGDLDPEEWHPFVIEEVEVENPEDYDGDGWTEDNYLSDGYYEFRDRLIEGITEPDTIGEDYRYLRYSEIKDLLDEVFPNRHWEF